jgi:hypothetical protein
MKKVILVLGMMLLTYSAFARMEPTVSADAAEYKYDKSAETDEHGWNTVDKKERTPAAKADGKMTEEKKLLDDTSKKLDAIYSE